MHVLTKNREKFFEKVEMNTPEEVIYIPIKAAASGKEKVFREVHKDFSRGQKI